MTAPITYVEGAFDGLVGPNQLWDSIAWENRAGAPRYESWMNDYALPYTYGSGDHARTYEAVAWHPLADEIRGILNETDHTSYDCCFINGYAHQHQHLGWHADDSPEMDHEHPIAVVSFGAPREIWFRAKREVYAVVPDATMLLASGSLLVMHAGMQRDWQHRIPKADREVTRRISLTFRRLVR